ncbi:MAG: polysaccharide deacetylase family protein [Alsobacter sp.]
MTISPSAMFHAMANSLAGPPACLFTFHRACKEQDWESLPDRGFYLSVDLLDHLLGHLAETGWTVTTMDEVHAFLAEGGRGERRLVNLSIDDCYRDTYELLVPVFRRHGVPVTLHVTTGIPDGSMTLWRAGLETLIAAREEIVADGQRVELRDAAGRRATYQALCMAWEGPEEVELYREFCAENGADADALQARHAITWDMLQELRRDPFVEIGAHTISHPRIAALAEEDAAREMGGSAARLRDVLGAPVRHFAFPYGRAGDCGPRDFALAERLGFATAATTRKGIARRGADPLRLPRNTLNGAHRSMMAVEAHLSGATGLAARVLGRV